MTAEAGLAIGFVLGSLAGFGWGYVKGWTNAAETYVATLDGRDEMDDERQGD